LKALILRLASSTLLVAVLLTTVYWSHSHWLPCLLVCEVITFLGLREVLSLLRAKQIQVFEFYTLAGGMALTAVIFFSSFPENLSGDLVVWTFFTWCIGLFFLRALQPSVDGATQTLFCSIGALLYVVVLFGFLIKINFLESVDGRWFVYYTFATVYAADICAYATGMLLGRRRLAPAISPKKTVEGAVGGLLGACAGSLIAQRFLLPEVSVLHVVALGILIGVVSQVGDLWESMLKRDAHTKDSGKTIPGMGGVLDLMDGLLWCAPLVYLYLRIIVRL